LRHWKADNGNRFGTHLNAKGLKTVLIGTGQTGLMQGAKYGIAMDAVPPQFCCGELEGAIVAASEAEQPDVILIEGQGALSHPAFCTSAFILRVEPAGCCHPSARAQTCTSLRLSQYADAHVVK
jgi:uncharacterized NAD-dependent epimerase/dehydratase family protein